MLMFEQPQLENYESYQHFALAALGYAIVSKSGGACCVVKAVVGGSHCESRLRCGGLACICGIPNGSRDCDATRVGGAGGRNGDGYVAIGGRSLGLVGSCVDSCNDGDHEGGDGAKDDRCGVRDRVGSDVGLVSSPTGDRKVDGVIPVESSDVVGDVFERGVNWHRNQEWKARRKARKLKKQRMQSSWRDVNFRRLDVSCDSATGLAREGANFPVVDNGYVGVFSGCDDSVRNRLRDSWAESLILKNELSADAARRKLARNRDDSEDVRHVQRFLRVSRLAERLKKNAKDTNVSGWASTVADSVVDRVASEAPSSVPSLESVGYGKSALRSTNGSEVDSARLSEYELQMKLLEEKFDACEVVSDDDYTYEVEMLKEKYADVSMTVEERVRRECTMDIATRLIVAGVSPVLIEEIAGLRTS